MKHQVTSRLLDIAIHELYEKYCYDNDITPSYIIFHQDMEQFCDGRERLFTLEVTPRVPLPDYGVMIDALFEKKLSGLETDEICKEEIVEIANQFFIIKITEIKDKFFKNPIYKHGIPLCQQLGTKVYREWSWKKPFEFSYYIMKGREIVLAGIRIDGDVKYKYLGD